MATYFFIWSDETVVHLAENDVTPEDFEDVVCHPADFGVSHSTGRNAAFGYTADGRYIIAVYELIDEMTVEPFTAYEVPEPRD